MSSPARGPGRRAKIVCTLGPAVDGPDATLQLMQNGMDAARINMSFGSPEEHVRRIRDVRSLMGPTQRPVAVIADLPGRKIRVGQLQGGSVQLETGDTARFVVDEGQRGDARQLPVQLGFFHENMSRGDPILLSDGVVELEVADIRRNEVEAEVIYGGQVGEKTGVHCQGVPTSGPPITEQDRPLLQLAIEERADYVALSWVSDDRDLLVAREMMAEMGREIPIIAKIERPEAFARLDGILRRADAVMIRRGDLGAQMEVTRVPSVQKEILRLANRAGVPVIIATQMLGSMIEAPRPTRAEASDVSNAIADGADGVLLSAETAIGDFPVDSVAMMARIVRETELEGVDRLQTPILKEGASFAETTASIAVDAANRIGAKMIVCFTESGRTAELVARSRPRMPILAFCRSNRTRRRLALPWGVRTDRMVGAEDVESLVDQVEDRVTGRGLAEAGDRLVLVFGSPMGASGRTNTVRLHRVSGGSAGSR
ncbi:MAG: pyruvate kinase [Myxococcota bacterium]